MLAHLLARLSNRALLLTVAMLLPVAMLPKLCQAVHCALQAAVCTSNVARKIFFVNHAMSGFTCENISGPARGSSNVLIACLLA